MFLFSVICETQSIKPRDSRNNEDNGQRDSSELASFIFQSSLLEGICVWNITDDMFGDNWDLIE